MILDEMAFVLHVHGREGSLKFTSWPLHFSADVQYLFYVVIAEDFDVIQHQLVHLLKDRKDLFVEVKTQTECRPVSMHVVGLARIGEGVQMYYKVVAESLINITDYEENDEKLDDSVNYKDTSVVELGTSEGSQIADALFGLQDEDGPDVLLSHKHGTKYWVRTPPGRDGLCTQKLILLQQIQSKQLYLMFTTNAWNFKSVPFMLQPGREYRCLVMYSTWDKTSDFLQIGAMVDGNNNNTLMPDELRVHHFAQASKERVTSIYFTKQELDKMRLKAVEFVHRKKQRVAAIPYFYRNKDVNYYRDIMCEQNDGIMYPKLKDNNGDRYSVVNSNIEGIFFSALLLPSTLRPPDTSIFGTRRCYIRSTLMLNNDTNMYFADFYCYNNVVHYVTIVLTMPRSEPDLFCSKNLVQLDPYSNPFLQLATLDGVQKVLVTLNVVVEVFYTEPIDLMALSILPGAALFEDVKVIGRGSSVEGGLPKKEDCDLCNLRMC